MIKILKFSIGTVIATLAIFGMFSQVSALTTSSDTQASGCASGAIYNTITGAACTDVVMNPPALGVLPVGCDLGVGTVYSPETGESCSINGVTITPPIVMMYPWDAYGCKAGSPYSMTTGNKCAGFSTSSGATSTSDVCEPGVMYSTKTGTKCPLPLPPVYDCMTAKNAYCAGISNASGLTLPVNGACADGTVKMYNTSTGAAYCASTTTNTPPTWIPPTRISSTSDVVGLQNALNRILGIRLAASLVADGKMGPRTIAAIRMFQTQAGITADGKVGPITLEKLRTSAY